MKKRVICFLILIFTQCFFLPLVYAEDIKIPVIEERPNSSVWPSELENEANLSIDGKNINFLSRGGVNVFSAEVIRPKEIIITEEEQGTFKEGSKIYLSVQSLELYEYISVETIQGDIVVDCKVMPNGIIEITIIEESTYPSVFRIFNIAVNSQEDYKKTLFRYPTWSYEKTILYSYPLMLLTEDNNNAFKGLEEDAELNSRFAVLQDFPMEPSMSMYYSKRVVVEKDAVTINDDKYFLSSSCYLKDGYYMVPLREMLGYIWNISDENIIWDNETKSVRITDWFGLKFVVTANTYTWAYGEDIKLHTSSEIKDGVMYIAFRDYINITGMGRFTNFYWDSDNFLVVFN